MLNFKRILSIIVVVAIAMTISVVSIAAGSGAGRSSTKTVPASTPTPRSPSNQRTLEQSARPSALAASEEDAPTQVQLKALQKESQNPVGSLAIVPFQSNWNYAAGPTKSTVWNLNIQPTGSQAASGQGNEAQSEGGAGAVEGAPTPAEMKALIKASQNPVGNIAILPFQNNWNYAAGPTKTTVWNMNIQPVVPFMLSPKSNLIERVITPVINLTPLLPDTDCFALGIETTTPCGAQLGIGNIQLQTYYAPKTDPNGLIWGAGPIFSFPTVTQHLGTQQFGGGINAVGLVMPGSWVMGILLTQRWYIAGPSASAQDTLNSFLAQPFINYNFGKGWALTEAPIITANWNRPGDQKWTVPIGLQISNTNTWLKLPMQYGLAYYGNVVRPQFAPYGLIRFNWSILWPVKRGRP